MNYKETVNKVFISIILTMFVYSFYYIEFIRENVEDFSFDLVNKFILSTQEKKVDAPNLLLLKIDDNYLKEEKLLDKNGETTYGYLFPRKYLAQIITNIDVVISDMDKENRPKALFVDYDISYKSDPNNIIYTQDDLSLIEVLKKDRQYKIYLPKTSNHNFVENLDDETIQKKIKSKDIVFVSVDLTVSNDGVSRRYYPYQKYLSNNQEETIYPLVDIELYKQLKGNIEDITKNFSQNKIALVENRIIFKDYKEKETIDNSEFIQSYWKNLKLFSANYPLDYIPEEDFKDAIIYLGGSHSNSDDFFQKDTFNKEISGIEMHANALMTIFYFDGKLNRLPITYALLIIATVILLSDVVVKWIILKIKGKENLSKFVEFLKNDAYIFLVFGILFVISYYILVEYKQWFNWFIPSLMATFVPVLTVSYNFIKRKNIKIIIKNILLITLFQKLIKFIKGEKK